MARGWLGREGDPGGSRARCAPVVPGGHVVNAVPPGCSASPIGDGLQAHALKFRARSAGKPARPRRDRAECWSTGSSASGSPTRRPGVGAHDVPWAALRDRGPTTGVSRYSRWPVSRFHHLRMGVSRGTSAAGLAGSTISRRRRGQRLVYGAGGRQRPGQTTTSSTSKDPDGFRSECCSGPREDRPRHGLLRARSPVEDRARPNPGARLRRPPAVPLAGHAGSPPSAGGRGAR